MVTIRTVITYSPTRPARVSPDKHAVKLRKARERLQIIRDGRKEAGLCTKHSTPLPCERCRSERRRP